jgi:penicillin G amidase
VQIHYDGVWEVRLEQAPHRSASGRGENLKTREREKFRVPLPCVAMVFDDKASGHGTALCKNHTFGRVSVIALPRAAKIPSMRQRRWPLCVLLAQFALVGCLGVGGPQAAQPTVQDLGRQALARLDGEVPVPGIAAPVEVIRDRWGVPHIYASSAEDLFFAQGYVAAQDRLWQMEMWRRAAEGRLSEVLGPQAFERDRLARLLRYRGPMDDSEWTVYHPDARRLMDAHARGVNAYIDQHAGRLPVEFVLTGIRPEPWTRETLVHRQNSFGNATSELQLARQVAQLGAEEANRRANPDPADTLRVPDGLDIAAFERLGSDLLAAARAGGPAPRPAILPQYRGLLRPPQGPADDGAVREPGSNNWVVSGALSATGMPVVANDPHREVANPSLRYLVHLHAPGWNVIGATEPPFLGVAIGHNERLGWGLTIVGTDQHDVFVEELNPANHGEVRWHGRWEPLRIVREEILVKGEAPRTVEMKFSRHGPIFYEDSANHRAYALRSALHEPGTAPYLGSLRLAQARDCRDFLEAANYWYAPSENLICGDVDGNISWQASARTPNRQGWNGRLPVPATGQYAWDGFRKDLPRELNPDRGFIATANHNVNPPGYLPPLMFMSADAGFSRITRLLQMLRPGERYTLTDHQRMQTDALSLRAVADLPLFRGWTSDDPVVERGRVMLAGWDGVYARDSAAAALYQTLRQGSAAALAAPVDREALGAALREAVARLASAQGAEWTKWRWGRMHTRAFPHPFIAEFNLPAVERPGGAGTVAADGASFREILNTADWDQSLVTNTPGQSGQPGSPFYDNLLPLWASDTYFPLVFTRGAVEEQAAHRLTLRPSSR